MNESMCVIEGPKSERAGNTLQLVLATVAFAACFAVFGSVSAMMPIMRKHLGFTPVQVFRLSQLFLWATSAHFIKSCCLGS